MTKLNSKVKPEHLSFIKSGVEFIQHEEPTLVEALKSVNTAKLTQIFNDDFGWAYLYEYPSLVITIPLSAALGYLHLIKEKLDSGIEINQAIIEVSKIAGSHSESFLDNLLNQLDENQTLEQFKNVRFGFNHMFNFSDLYALIYANLGNFAALRKFGKEMYHLVEDVRQGKEESLFHAIQIDPTVLSCTPFVKRMSIAHMQGDTKFLHTVSNALKTKWKKPKADLEALRVSLSALNELNQLNHLSQTEAAKIFIDELEMYSSNGEDPERSLYRFIQRYKSTM